MMAAGEAVHKCFVPIKIFMIRYCILIVKKKKKPLSLFLAHLPSGQTYKLWLFDVVMVA